jgi:hypothetical protein
MANIRKPVNSTAEKKLRKNPFERRDRLSFNKDPKYHTQWFNDTGTTIQDMLDAGFQFVSTHERYGQVDTGNIDNGSSTTDSRVAVNVGRAGGQENVTGYLMRIPVDEWEELVQPLREEAKRPMQEITSQIKTMKQDGYYGEGIATK